MAGENLRDLNAFVLVEESSFTRVVARLGVSQSALRQTIRALRNAWACVCSTARHDASRRAVLHQSAPAQSRELFAWAFRNGDKEHRIKVEGQPVFSTLPAVLMAALAGFGLAYVPEAMIKPQVEAGRLIAVLTSWRQNFERYNVYYSSRRLVSPAFSLLVNALCYSE